MGNFSKLHLVCPFSPRHIWLGFMATGVCAVLVDIDHLLYKLFGWGEPPMFFSDHPGRYLHDDLLIAGLVLIVLGLWISVKCISRYSKIGVLK